MKKRELPSLRFLGYVATFALGVGSAVFLRYVAKVIASFQIFKHYIHLIDKLNN